MTSVHATAPSFTCGDREWAEVISNAGSACAGTTGSPTVFADCVDGHLVVREIICQA